MNIFKLYVSKTTLLLTLADIDLLHLLPLILLYLSRVDLINSIFRIVVVFPNIRKYAKAFFIPYHMLSFIALFST